MTDNTQIRTDGGGNQPVGKVVIQYGQVKAVGTDGTERVLAPNSPIFLGDHIITGPDGMVSVIFDADGTQLDLGRMSDAFVDQDMVGGADAATAEDMAAEVADIQQAMEQGDIDQILDLPAPAAGEGIAGAGGGHPYPVFDVDGDEMLPEFGLETTGIGYDFLDPDGGGITVAEEPIPEPEEPVVPPPPPPPPPVDIPSAGNGTSLVVDEAQMVHSDSQPSLSFTAGTDPLVSFVFSEDLSGLLANTDGLGDDDVTWVRVSDTIIQGMVDGDVAITLTLSAPDTIAANTTGTVTVTATLTGAFPHPPEGGTQTLNLGQVGVIATETDGDSVEVPVFVAVIDDVPAISATGSSVDETDGVTGDVFAPISVNGSISELYGADGSGSVALAAAGATWAGNTLTADDNSWNIVLNGDGTYTFNLLAPQTHPDDTDQNDALPPIQVTATVTDGDGDTASTTFDITIYDDGPAITAGGASIDETDGVTDDVFSPISVNGSISALYGADGAGSVELAADGATWAGNILTADDGSWNIVLNGDGTYTFNLLAPQTHPDDTDPNDALPPIQVTATVTDSDGDTASTTFDITIYDDGPTVSENATVLLDDDALAGGNPGGIGDDVDAANVTGTLAHSFGADGGSITWLADGAPAGFTYEADGDDLLIKQDGT
ncbi:MAG: retention module-containing protein, partial [Desulfobulbaceae bacterium]|nr:retention module-containing protein [Desulfobulbaceae bacterium]